MVQHIKVLHCSPYLNSPVPVEQAQPLLLTTDPAQGDGAVTYHYVALNPLLQGLSQDPAHVGSHG